GTVDLSVLAWWVLYYGARRQRRTDAVRSHAQPSAINAQATGVVPSAAPLWPATRASAATFPDLRRSQSRTPGDVRSRRPLRERAGFSRSPLLVNRGSSCASHNIPGSRRGLPRSGHVSG